MIDKDNKASQNYVQPNLVTTRYIVAYKKQLKDAIQAKNVGRVKIILSVLAALSPLEYIDYLSKIKKK